MKTIEISGIWVECNDGHSMMHIDTAGIIPITCDGNTLPANIDTFPISCLAELNQYITEEE